MNDPSPFEIEDLVKGYRRGVSWHCTFYTPAGRQRRALATRNKRQAQRRAREVADLIQQEDWEGLAVLDWKPKPQAGTFSTFVYEEFLPKYCSWSESTRRSEDSRLKILCERFGALPLAGITAKSIKAWLAERETGGMSVASQNRYLADLKSIYKAAVAFGYCRNNPTAAVTMRTEEVKPKDVLSDEEFERLLEALPKYARRIVVAAHETGMRAGEIRRLTWADIDLEAAELRVAVAKNKEYRIVPLTDRLRALLTGMCEGTTPRPKDLVFGTMDIKKGLAAALKRAKIDKHITLHSFRHQFATRALEAGVSSFHLQAIGGWKTPAMLQRYGKVRNRALHEQMAKLNGSAAAESRAEDRREV